MSHDGLHEMLMLQILLKVVSLNESEYNQTKTFSTNMRQGVIHYKLTGLNYVD